MATDTTDILDFPHEKTKILCKFTPKDYGPLNVIHGKHFNNFIAGTYYLTTPKETITLYRVHGGKASEYGQYWSHDPREGNLGYRFDAAVLEEWNSMDKYAILVVPAGVHMYEGKVSKQAHYLGGGWQVFIPWEVMNHLTLIQPHKLGQCSSVEVEKTIEKINNVQKRILDTYLVEDSRLLQERSLKLGSELWKLSPEIRSLLQSEGKTDREIPTGTYVLHKDSIPVIGCGRKDVTVSVRIEFDHSETRTYRSGEITVTETINYYNRITEFTETIP